MQTDVTGRIRGGQEALARGSWDESRALFAEALEREETPEGFEGLGHAVLSLGDESGSLAAHEKAYRLYQDRGDRRSAARLATGLALAYEATRRESAVASGWLGRARRLLEGLDPGPEHAWFAFWEAHLDLLCWNETERAHRRIAEALALSRSLRLPDAEMVSLALEGIVLVHQGQVAEGMRRLDEITTAVVAGEVKDLTAAGNACCYLLTACEQVGDYDRLRQWFERVRAYFAQWRHQPALTFCRNHLIGVLLWRGAWKEAEAEIEALRRESAVMAPGFVSEGTVRLGELRRRQGRLQEAAVLFAQVEPHPYAWLGRAAIALDGGDPESAGELVDRFFRRLPPGDRIERVPGLEVLIRASLALGRREEAEAALVEITALSKAADTDAIRAATRAAEGAVAAAAGDHETARRRFEDAVDLYERSGSPFEAARVRVDLARTLHALGRGEAAEREARSALATFEGIGAAREVERAACLLGRQEGERPVVPGLTRRETEVLRLVAEGLSNAAIAEKLFLSEHTVKRHVANILTKLSLPSRAAAAARAARLGVL